MADKTIKLTLDIQTKISNLEGQVNKIQKEFDKLEGPKAAMTPIEKSLKALQEKFAQVKSYIDNNELSFADEKKARSELREIEKEYSRIASTIESNKGSFSLKGTAKSLEEARKKIEEYKESVKDTTKAIAAQQRKIDGLKASIETVESSRDAKINAKNAKATVLSNAKQEAEDLQKELDEVNQSIAETTKKLTALRQQSKSEAEAYGRRTDPGRALYGTKQRAGLYQRKIDKMTERDDLEVDVSRLQKEAEDARKAATAIADERKKLEDEIKNLEKSKSDAEFQVKNRKNNRANVPANATPDTKRRWDRQVQEAENHLRDIEQKLADKQKQLAGLTNKESQKKADDANTRASQAEAAYNQAKQKLEAAKKELEDIQAEIDKQEPLLNKKVADREAKNEKDRDKTAEIEAQKELNEARARQAELTQKVTDATEKVNNATNEYNEAENNAKKAIEDANEELEKANNELADAENVVNDLKDKLTVPFDNLKNTLSDLSKKGVIDLGDIDLDSIHDIEALEKALDKIGKDKSKVEAVLHTIDALTHKGAKGTKELSENVEKTVEFTEQLDSELENIKSRIVHFFGLANAVNLFKRAVRSAFETVKDLDKVMAETAVVTNFSVGDMWEQLPEYTRRANELGVSIHDAYEAATLYYQQGLKTNEVMAVSNETLKMARIAGLDAAEATDRMTNALRGFNMTIDETNAKNINDVYSNLAAKTASNVDEISTAMTKVASLASNANMSFENTTAFLSQIIETTRESAETAGTALKTVIARFSEVKSLYSEGELLGKDAEGEEIDVNKVSKALRTAGINLNEYLTGAKGLDEIFMELSAKWDSLDRVQQRYIATMAAGSRQQSRFIALMQDNARMTELVGEANNAAGASQKQFEKTLESLQSKLEKLHNAWNTFLMSITNSDVIKFFIDRLTDIISVVNKLTEGLTGVPKSLASIGIAIGAFKLGRGILHKLLGNMGKALLPGLANIGKQGGTEISQGIVKGFNIKGFAKNIKLGFTQIFSKQIKLDPNRLVSLETNGLSEALKTQLKQAVIKLKDIDVNSKINIKGLIDKGNITEAEQELNKFGHTIQTVTDESGKTSATIKNTSVNLNAIGSACATAGAGLMIVVSILEKIGVKNKPLLNGLKAFAVGLTTIPVLFRVIEASGVMAGTAIQASFGWISVVLIAIVAIGVALAAIIKQNSPAEKLRQAQEAAQAAADAANEAKEAYNNLGDSFDSLSDKYKKLKDLIQGTREWRDAVFEINQQVLELTKKYPELSKLVTNKNGVLTIDLDSKAAQDVMDQYFNRSMQAANAEVLAQINVAQKNIDNEYNKLKLGPNLRPNLERIARGIASGQGGVTLDEQKAWVSEQLDYSYHSNQTIKALSQFGKLLVESDQQLDNFNNSLAANAVHMAGLEGEQATSATNLLGSELVKTIQKQISDNIEENADNLKFDDAYRQYWTSRYGAVTFGNKGEISYIDENNKPQTISAELARSTYAAAQGADALAEAAKQFANGIGNASEEFQKVFAAKNGGALTREDIKKFTINGEISETRIKDEFEKIYGSTDENLELWNQFLARTREYIGFAETAIINAEAFFEKNGFDITKLGGLTSDQISGLSNVMKQVLLTSGKDVADDMLGLVTKNQDFLNALKFVDFTDIKSIRNLGTVFEDLGLESLTTTKDFKELKNQLLEVALASQKVDVPKIKQSIAALSGISAKFMRGEATRTWSKEEYDAMSQYLDDSILKNFHANEDGSYTYLGNSMEELQKAVEENTTALRSEGIEDINAQIRARGILNGTVNYSYYTGGVLQAKGESGFINGITDAKDLSEGARKQILSSYLKRLQLRLSDKELEGTKLGISSNTDISKIVNSDEFEAYWNKFMDLAMNESLEAERASLSKEEIDELVNLTNTELANKGTEEAFGQLKLRGLEAGMSNDVFEQADITQMHEFSTLVTAYQQAIKDGIDIGELETYAKQLQNVNDAIQDNVAALTLAAVGNMRFNKGLEEVVTSYKDWDFIIDDVTGELKVTTAEGAQAFNKLKASVNLMLGTSKPLSDQFWNTAANMKLLEQAALGDIDALKQLRIAAMQDYAVQLQMEFNEAGAEKEAVTAIGRIADLITTADLPDLEPGVELTGKDQFIKDLLNLAEIAGLTTDQINGFLTSVGFRLVPDHYDNIPVGIEYQNFDVPGGKTGRPQRTNKGTIVYEKVPVGWKIVSTGSGNRGINPNIITGMQNNNEGKNGSSSSGSSDSSKPSYWKNPYDELFNLQEKINETLRDREELERRYQKLLKNEHTTVDQIRQSYRDQIAIMQRQIALQRQLAAGRLRQIQNLGNQYYTDSEGNRRTYASLGVTQYAHYNAETGEFTIDWDRLEQIANDAGRTAEGEAAEAYINALQELINSYEETRDAIWEIEDAIESLNNELIESYMNFEDRVMDALVASYEREIESLEKINDAINNATSKVLDGIQDEINAQRQERDNAKREQEIADKEARLAYLRLDTSGANSLEIMQLEKELEEARENYGDTLIDQALEQMRKDADLAAEQRAEQIELMRAQLEEAKKSGELWPRVHDLINNAFENGELNMDSDLVKLLQDIEGFFGLSAFGQDSWLAKLIEEFLRAMSGLEAGGAEQAGDHQGGTGNGEGITQPSNPGNNEPGGNNSPTEYPYGKASETHGVIQKGSRGEDVKAIQWALNQLGFGNAGTENVDGVFGGNTEKAVKAFQRDVGISEDGKVGNQTRRKFAIKGYKTGGLADFTGPAWLDGTKSHPEMVLNARDTENLITLKNILANLMAPDAQTTRGFGDAYFDIDINADISSDYDVDQLAERIKQQIVQDARYRNINMVNFMR